VNSRVAFVPEEDAAARIGIVVDVMRLVGPAAEMVT
jgi:hypothetical protein